MQSIESKSLSNFGLVKNTIEFFGRHFILIFGLGVVAALGRAIQLGARGEVSGGVDSFLEIVIATARILTFLFVLGESKIGDGVKRVISVFQLDRAQWKSIGSNIIYRLKSNWLALLINLVVYSAIAMMINFLIDNIAYNSNFLNLFRIRISWRLTLQSGCFCFSSRILQSSPLQLFSMPSFCFG